MKQSTLLTSEVTDLQFTEITDKLQHNWVEWAVEFEHKGQTYGGYLQACPFHPHMMHDVTIDGIEQLVA